MRWLWYRSVKRYLSQSFSKRQPPFSREIDILVILGGSALVVSNFTLAADYSHGNRPSYIEAARPEIAEPLYLDFAARLRALVGRVECGEFGADMKIEMMADGPVTIVMESDKLRKGKRSV